MAGPHTLYDVRGGLPDAQDTEMFDFFIPRIPGGSMWETRDIAVACQQAVYPGRSNEMLEVPLHGFQFHFAGRVVTPRQLQVVYVENYAMGITNTFQSWFEFQRGTISGTSRAYKRGYALDGSLLIKYDTTGRIADSIEFFGLQPEDMPDVQLDGSSSNVYMVNMTFRYDFYLPRNIRSKIVR